jgi:hypothetical protein
MDKNSKCCGFLGITSLKNSQIFGLVIILLAILLTFGTYEGSAILGMFIAGIVLFKGSCGCKCCCHHHQSCEQTCHTESESCDVKAEKKPKSKAKAK